MEPNRHLLLKISCTGKQLEDDRFMHNLLLRAVKAANGSVVGVFRHEFHPVGLTSMVALAESHATVHTWPEDGFALVDYFSCSDDPRFDDFKLEWELEGFDIVSEQVLQR